MSKRELDIEITPELQFAKSIALANINKGLRYCRESQILYEWTGIYWHPLDIGKDVQQMSWKWLTLNRQDFATPAKATCCAQAAILEATSLPIASDAATVRIPCLNGTVDIVQQDDEWIAKLRPADRNDGLKYCISCSFDPLAAAPRFDSFITEVLADEEVRDFVQEYVGYSLMGDN
jgi:phage/plasmid-associated DNA primase